MDFFDIGIKDLNLIKNLWENNRIYHENSSEYFSELYNGIFFEERMKKLENLNDDMFRITICKEENDVIGYCISTIVDGNGEVESIHVDESKRCCGVGMRLVDEHLKWMNERKCKSIGVTVSQENTNTINFYKKLGFYPNTINMQQLPKK